MKDSVWTNIKTTALAFIILFAFGVVTYNVYAVDLGTTGGITNPSSSSSSSLTSSFQVPLDEIADQQNFEIAWKSLITNRLFTIGVKKDDKLFKINTTDNTVSGFHVFGNTDLGANVNVYIFTTKLSKTTNADQNGHWDILITDPVSKGIHTAYGVSTINGQTTRAETKFRFDIDTDNGTVLGVTTEESSTSSALSSSTSSSTTGTGTDYNNLIIGLLIGLLSGILIALIIFFARRKRGV